MQDYIILRAYDFNLFLKIVLFEMYFFLYEKFQAQVGNKVVCQEMDPYSKNSFAYFNLYIFLKARAKCQNMCHIFPMD